MSVGLVMAYDEMISLHIILLRLGFELLNAVDSSYSTQGLCSGSSQITRWRRDLGEKGSSAESFVTSNDSSLFSGQSILCNQDSSFEPSPPRRGSNAGMSSCLNAYEVQTCGLN